jgi:DNA invertase Pin-like site-specific DNA recombinase
VKAVLYTRVSLVEMAKDGVSLPAQEEKLRAYCLSKGMEVAEVVVDAGVSGTVPLERRMGGARLLSMLRTPVGKNKGRLAVAAVRLDRLFRNARDALTHIDDWRKGGVGIHLLDLGLDTTTPAGALMVTVMAGVAQMERDVLADRTAAAMKHLRDSRRLYNHPPLGYGAVEDRARNDGTMTYRLVAEEREMAVVRRIHSMRADGMSMGRIARALNEEGIIGKAGGRFYASTIQRVLANPIQAP